jgi:hypothetical protein
MDGFRRTRGPGAVVALLIVMAIVPSTAAAAGWTVPFALPGAADSPAGSDVAAGPDGTVVVAFTTRNPDSSSQVMAMVRPPGGEFSPPEALGSPLGGFPVVAVDGQGTATVVWEQRVGSSALHTIQQSTRPAGGSFSAPQDLSGFSGEGVEADIAANSRGDTLVTWTNRRLSPNHVEAIGRPAGGTFAPPGQRVSGPDVPDLDAFDPRVAMGEDGSGMVVWERQDARVRARPWSAASNSFGTLFDVSVAAELGNSPDVAVTPTGDAVFVYSADVPGGEAIMTRTRTSGGLGGPEDLAPATAFARSPRLVASPGGDMLAAWRSAHPTSAAVVIRAAFRPTGQAFQSADTLSGTLTGLSPAPATAITPAGDAIVAWTVPTPGGVGVQARTRPRSGPFSAIQDDFPTRPSTGVNVFADGEGNMGTLSRRDASTLELRPFDNAPPRPLALALPPDAAAGRAAAFSAAFRDTWSPFSIAWSFGDGGAVSGGSAEHTYGAPGTFAVTATATDAVGNASAQSAPLAVRALRLDEIDADGDGFTADRDCDDANPAIRPDAKEIRGNAVDENCDKVKAPFRKVAATASLSGLFGSGFIELKTLTVTSLVRGDVVRLRCKGRGCRSSLKASIKVKRKTRSLSLTGRVAGVRLRKGARLEVRISHRNRIARIFRFTIKRLGELPVKTERCLPPGAKKPRKC